MIQILHRLRWLIGLTAAILVLGAAVTPAGRAQTNNPLTDQEFERAIIATTKIFILGPDNKPLGTCSGTFFDKRGYVLTNFHCIGHTDLYGEDDSGLGLENGELYHPEGLVILAPTINDRDIPKPMYVAKAVSGDPRMDTAVVQIVGMLKESQKLPNPLPIVTIKQADSDKVKTRDYMGIIGYPGVGGPTLTFTEGSVSGFEDQDGDGINDSFKTTAEIAGGNSGGLAINADGQQIGIPTYGFASGADKIDRVKMVNAAIPVMKEALSGKPATPGQPSQPNQPNQPSQPSDDEGVILTGKIVDADTKRGVPGALVVILKPGVSFDEFEQSNYDDALVATEGVADRSGNYRTTQPLVRGQVYTAIIGAKGYQPRVFEDGLEITDDDPELLDMKDVALQKR